MKVIIAEDQGMLRGALKLLLDMEEDIEVVAQAENGEEALKLVRELNPDICLLDIEMPKLTGLDVAERLKEEGHPCRVVILTTFSRTGYFQRALKAGVKGYLLKDSPVDELSAALRTIHQGERVVSTELSLSLWEAVAVNPLTEREQAVLRLVADGLAIHDIASKLYLSRGTVRNYVSKIMQKLGAKNRIEAINIAETNGWLV
ncbi:two-component system response regulator [Paenibacillus yonginensis]|uniref:Two-component system response regulator n=1 Tax=Paenibacillus yonginensis TaxID=1462996 RepID=A0A1B1N543_9BACL|nr:response regulator transcription factor [Paenibacillus yonginensis]ANS76571.1 two-component system response regulator [Paenibacillus yonginensis]